jgi:hypothetical protein
MSQIKAGKATVSALIVGVLLGPIAIYQLLPILPLNIAGSLVTSILMYFLPALTALLFAQWREKKNSK